MLPGTERHPHARAVLGAALGPSARPSHAYLFHGPAGTGKRDVARALAAELLTAGAADPAGARARVEHGAHPDLTWVTPSGAHEMLTADVEEPVVAAASRTPFEAARRVFVLERADTLIEAAANKLLKTLEEPPPHVHLILVTDRLGDVLPTLVSRCQAVRFDPLPPGVVAERLERRGVAADAAQACARLALVGGNDPQDLALGEGVALREAAEAFARGTLRGTAGPTRAWETLLAECARRGDRVREDIAARAEAARELASARDRRRLETEWNERSKRGKRRAETEWLGLGLRLVGLWFRDLLAVRAGAPELAHHADRAAALAEDAEARDPAALRRAVELVEDTRERLVLNVTEPLACEALAYRLEEALAA